MSKAKTETPVTTGKIETTAKGKVFFMDISSFRTQKGEKLAGLNIIKLGLNEAAGPLVLARILLNQKLNPKYKETVDVYIATDSEGGEWRAPASASFVTKAKESKLSIGDTFAILRSDDYISKLNSKACQSYELTIMARAGKKSVK